MHQWNFKLIVRVFNLLFAIIGGILIFIGTLVFARTSSRSVHAAPIEPPEGYPKFNISTKVVTPTLTDSSVATLQYIIDIVNTGAYTATGTEFSDEIPIHTLYNNHAWSSVNPQPTFSNGAVRWVGTVGFDSSVQISFTVTVDPGYEGVVSNTAVIDHEMIAQPVTVTSEAMATDYPVLVIEKTSDFDKPGASKTLTYTLTVENKGQPAVNMPITVTDKLPLNTEFRSVDPSGTLSGTSVVWTKAITLGTGQSTTFTFSVNIEDVTSGTIINNDDYSVQYLSDRYSIGEPYTLTVIDPILLLSKETWPFPPSSNCEMI